MSDTEARLAEANAEIERLRRELRAAARSLLGAASAYRTFARRHSSLTPKAEVDALFTTRAADFDRAAERARAAAIYPEVFVPPEPDEPEADTPPGPGLR